MPLDEFKKYVGSLFSRSFSSNPETSVLSAASTSRRSRSPTPTLSATPSTVRRYRTPPVATTDPRPQTPLPPSQQTYPGNTTPSAHWSEAEQDLYFRINMRGHEPLLPKEWIKDFRTLPTALFADKEGLPGGRKPYLKAESGSNFRATKALSGIFYVGMAVRTALTPSARPTAIIRRGIESYIRWALWDARLQPSDLPPGVIPIWAMHTLCKGKTTNHGLKRLNKKMGKIARHYRELDGEQTAGVSPVIYGFLIADTHVVIVTLDSNILPGVDLMDVDPIEDSVIDAKGVYIKDEIPDGDSGSVVVDSSPRDPPESSHPLEAKLIGRFNFAQEGGQDIWNGMAMALVVERMRRSLAEVVASAGEKVETDEDIGNADDADASDEGDKMVLSQHQV